MRLRIPKPDDSRTYYDTNIRCNTYNFVHERITHTDRSAKDPIQKGLEDFWRGILSTRRGRSHWDNTRMFMNFGPTFNHVVFINECPVLLSREGIRYHLNGKPYSLSIICSALARLTYKSCFEDSPEVLLAYLYSTLDLPENVKYCLENRAPFHFYKNYERQDVRLNVMQIDDKMMAMEISDGVWGEISAKDLDTYCNFYIHNKSRGSWKRLSPKKLYTRIMGVEPSNSELEVMIAFLLQNRMQDIVDSRAMELVEDMLQQYEGRLFAHRDEKGTLQTMYVKGRDYDWKLTNNSFKSGIQMVSTFVWQPDTDGNAKWRGPICIDNMAEGSPLGDQFATRALALLNDTHTIKIVNTIKTYLVSEPNKYRNDEYDDL